MVSQLDLWKKGKPIQSLNVTVMVTNLCLSVQLDMEF